MHVYLPEKVEKPNFRLTIGSCSRPVRRVSRERERQPREDQRRKIQEHEMLGKVKHSVFPMFASSSHMDQTLVLGSQLYFSGVSLYIQYLSPSFWGSPIYISGNLRWSDLQVIEPLSAKRQRWSAAALQNLPAVRTQDAVWGSQIQRVRLENKVKWENTIIPNR